MFLSPTRRNESLSSAQGHVTVPAQRKTRRKSNDNARSVATIALFSIHFQHFCCCRRSESIRIESDWLIGRLTGNFRILTALYFSFFLFLCAACRVGESNCLITCRLYARTIGLINFTARLWNRYTAGPEVMTQNGARARLLLYSGFLIAQEIAFFFHSK